MAELRSSLSAMILSLTLKAKVSSGQFIKVSIIISAEKVSSPESEEAKDEISKQPVVSRREVSASYSPKTRRTQMRISYAERDGEGKYFCCFQPQIVFKPLQSRRQL